MYNKELVLNVYVINVISCAITEFIVIIFSPTINQNVRYADIISIWKSILFSYTVVCFCIGIKTKFA